MDLSEINILPSATPADTGSGAKSPMSTAPEPPSFYPLNIEVHCNTSGDKTRAHVAENLKLGLEDITLQPEHGTPAILVGGGPSLRETWREVAWWATQGAHIFALNGAAKLLNSHGVTPHYQIIIDPRDNTPLVGDAMRYIIASQCDPVVFKALPLDRTLLVHLIGSAGAVPNKTLVGGDMTVGLVAMCTAHTIGYRTLRLYGYDSSHVNGAHHAYEQEQTEQESRLLNVMARGADGEMRSFTTNFVMAKQADMFPHIAHLLCEEGTVISVHGDGLLPTIAAAMQKPDCNPAETEKPAAAE